MSGLVIAVELECRLIVPSSGGIWDYRYPSFPREKVPRKGG